MKNSSKILVHIFSSVLLASALVSALPGCSESDLQTTHLKSSQAAEVLSQTASALPPGPVISDLRFILAASAAGLELIAGIAGGLLAKKKLVQQSQTIREIVVGLDDLRRQTPTAYSAAKLCQRATQTPRTAAIVASVKAALPTCEARP